MGHKKYSDPYFLLQRKLPVVENTNLLENTRTIQTLGPIQTLSPYCSSIFVQAVAKCELIPFCWDLVANECEKVV